MNYLYIYKYTIYFLYSIIFGISNPHIIKINNLFFKVLLIFQLSPENFFK